MPKIETRPPTLDDSLKVQRIVLVAMLLGIASLAFISVFVVRSGKAFAPQPLRLSLPLDAIALGFAAVAAIGSFLVPRLIEASLLGSFAKDGSPASWNLPADKAEAESALLMIDQQRFFVGIGLVEGAAMLNVIAYLLNGGAFPLIAAGLLALLLLSFFPGRSALEERIDRGRRELQEAARNG